MLLRLFVQLLISFPVLLCYNLGDMRTNLGAFFLILSYVSDRRELSLSERKLENLFFFTCLIYYLGATRKFSGQGRRGFLGQGHLDKHFIYNTWKKGSCMVKFWSLHSTTEFSRYPKASCLSKKEFHHRRLIPKPTTWLSME